MSATPLPVLDDRPQVSSWRLIATLAGSGALAGLLLVLTFQYTYPTVQAHRGEVLRGAIAEVLQAPAKADTLFLVGDALVATLPATADPEKTERVWRAYDAKGAVVGYGIRASEAGFADQIAVIFGYDATSKKLLGMKVLSHKETPGLGDKIVKPTFMAQFTGLLAPLVGVKDGAKGPSNVAMITGATISSRTIIREINNAVARWTPLIERYERTTAAARGQNR
ncbi:MAG TPA: FMN-binding protein [Gemmatimonadaceae bacterium]|nr:FMN-binding protein [Gemmatimonadaceae bacterium]